MKMIEDIIIKPVITEASMDMLSDENHKKYVFKVMKNATIKISENRGETL